MVPPDNVPSDRSSKTARPPETGTVTGVKVTPAGPLLERERRRAGVGRVDAADGIDGLGDDAENIALDDRGWRLGGDDRLAGQAVGGQVRDEEVGLGRSQPGDQVVAGAGVVAL